MTRWSNSRPAGRPPRCGGTGSSGSRLGAAAFFAAWLSNVRAALYVLVCASLAYGVFLLTASRLRRENTFAAILGDVESMSPSMRRLALVQFFSWFTLFTFYVYTTPAVAKMHFGTSTPGSPGYEAGANWVGVCSPPTTAWPRSPRCSFRISCGVSAAPRAPVQPVDWRRGAAVDAADPRCRLAAGLDGRTRSRLGVDHLAALRDARQQPSGAERWA